MKNFEQLLKQKRVKAFSDIISIQIGDILVSGIIEDNYKLEVEDNPNDEILTNEEISVLQQIINNSIPLEDEELFEEIDDEYFYNGVRREMFY